MPEDVFEILSFPKIDQWALDSDLERFRFEVMHVLGFAIGLD